MKRDKHPSPIILVVLVSSHCQLRNWWDNMLIYGPRLGYFPRADKSWFIVKSNLEQSARKIFAGTDVCQKVGRPASCAKCDCTISTSSSVYCIRFRHRFIYPIRTIPDIQTEMQLIDNIIDTKLLPALLDRTSTRHERQLLSSPARLGRQWYTKGQNVNIQETQFRSVLIKQRGKEQNRISILFKGNSCTIVQFCILQRKNQKPVNKTR